MKLSLQRATPGYPSLMRADPGNRVLVAVPAFNEERTVDRVLARITDFGLPVLVIDDGSTDATAARAVAHGVDLVRHGRNRGYGAAMRTALAQAEAGGFDWVITMDCDDQHEPAFIPRFLEAIALDDSDIVSGSRYLAAFAEDVPAPADRAAINGAITAAINAALPGAFAAPLTDSFCGFKAYRTQACAALHLTASGYEFPVQFWVQAAAHGLRVREIPVARIYLDAQRAFGNGLDDPQRRRATYEATLAAELARCEGLLRRLPAAGCVQRCR